MGLMYDEPPPGGDWRLDDSDVPVDTGELPDVELVTPPVPPPLIVGEIFLLLLLTAWGLPPDDFPDDLEPLLLPAELLFLDEAVLSVPL